jgi:hypothetical protein
MMLVSRCQEMNSKYRCHFTRKTRIVAGEHLRAMTFHQAIEEAERILVLQQGDNPPDGFEIWDRAILLYVSP